MRKKLLTVALAATMAVASVFSAFAEDVDCTGWWAAHSQGYEIGANGVDLTFSSKSYDEAASNWNTPIVVVYAADAKFAGGAGMSDTAGYTEYAVIRSDAYAWGPANANGTTGDVNSGAGADNWAAAGYTMENTGVPADDAGWAAWLEANKAGVNCTVKATKNNDKVVVELTNNGVTSKTTIPVDASKTIYISVSGELCKVTDLKEAAGGAPSTDPTPAPSDDKKDEPTTAPAGSKDNNVKPSQTGDTAAVAVVAIVALGAAVAVIASKKKVTE